MNTVKHLSRLKSALIGSLLCSSSVWASPFLGDAQIFSVLGASTVTNTGATTVSGDLGVSPGSSITGTGSITQMGGSTHSADPTASLGEAAALTAFNTLAGISATNNLTGVDLGSAGPLTPGVYKFNSSAQLTGTLTLNAENISNALFIFQIGSTLTTASNSIINLINLGVNDGIYWEVGSAATLGTNTLFAGNILADSSITLTTGADILCGRAIALNGAVTMDANVVSNNCSIYNASSGINDYSSAGFSGGFNSSSAVPEPSTLALLSLVAAGYLLSRPGIITKQKS
jgi:type VI secretion system secreted protein VgrG